MLGLTYTLLISLSAMKRLFLCSLVLLGSAGTVHAGTVFSNMTPISVPGSGTGPAIAHPYPSAITVTGLFGSIIDVNVSLIGVSHAFPRDIDVLLIGPSGASLELMTDVGGSSTVSGVNVVFDDSAPTSLTPTGTLVSGTFKPSDSDNPGFTGEPDVWLGAPSGPYGASLSVFNEGAPNGTYSLYVVDDFSADAGIMKGWSIELTVIPEPSTLVFATLSLLGMGCRWRNRA